MKKQQKKKITLKLLLILLLIIAVICFGFMFSRRWIHGEFKANESALSILTETHDAFTVERLE